MSDQTVPGNGVDAAPPPPMTSNDLMQRSVEPPNNTFMHGYRELTEALAKQLREFKDSHLQLWNDLHVVDGTSAEQRTFNNRELGFAAKHLEESMLWIEKFYSL